MRRLTGWRAVHNSVAWRLTAVGIETGRGPVRIASRYRDRLDRVPEAWRRYGGLIRYAARRYGVPVELFLAIIINESSLDPKAFQTYRGYVSDRRTPDRISVGLGAILISTARFMLNDRSIDRAWLEKPANNIRAIGVYLSRQYRMTGFDPPKVAAAYNAGGLYRQNGRTNRWKLRNYPVGTAAYIDQFVAVFDASMRYLARRPDRPRESFAALFAPDSIVGACAWMADSRFGHLLAQAPVRPPEAHDTGSAPVLASRSGPDDFLARYMNAGRSLQSRIPGRVPDDPAFAAAGQRTR